MKFSKVCLYTQISNYLPEHNRPSPEKPGLQVQLKDPAVLIQDAFLLQLWMSFVHSSISGKI